MITRRGIVELLALSLARGALPRASVCALATAAVPDRASAWVFSALQLAAGIAGTVVGSMQNGEALGQALALNTQIGRSTLNKLHAMHIDIAKVLDALESLPDQIDELLKNAYSRALQVRVQSTILGYDELLSRRDPRVSFAEWRQLDSTQNNVNELLMRLRGARQELSVLGVADPTMTLILPSAAAVEANLQNLAGYQPYETMRTLELVYMRWFRNVCDRTVATSAARYTEEALSKREVHLAAAKSSNVGSTPLFVDQDSSSRLCLGVSDYRPAYTIERESFGCENPPGPYKELRIDDARKFSALDQQPKMGLELQPLRFERRSGSRIRHQIACRKSIEQIPARSNPGERWSMTVNIKKFETPSSGNDKGGIIQYDIATLQTGIQGYGSPGLPDDNVCNIEVHDMPDSAARISRLDVLSKQAAASVDGLSMNISELNNCNLRIAFGLRALAIAEISQAKLRELQDFYR